MDVIMDVIESNYNHARMRAMRTLYARAADAICARHEIRPPGGATLGGLREMRRVGASRVVRRAEILPHPAARRIRSLCPCSDLLGMRSFFTLHHMNP